MIYVFQLGEALKHIDELLKGLMFTLSLSALAIVIGMITGWGVTIGRVSKIKIVSKYTKRKWIIIFFKISTHFPRITIRVLNFINNKIRKMILKQKRGNVQSLVFKKFDI